MRTIKFRAKSFDGEWVCGDLHLNCKFPHIHTQERRSIPIDPTTIGQFTGLYDKNGKEIYEGDIIGCDRPNIRHLIFYCEKEARFKAALNGETKMSILGICGLDDRRWTATKEVIGNIHDNPEMLKGGEQ